MPDQSTPQQQPPPSRTRAVYTVSRFAAELGISERTVRRLIVAAKIRTVPLSIGRIGIPASELDRVVAGGLLKVAEGAR
jgi:predicted transcriptional regulator